MNSSDHTMWSIQPNTGEPNTDDFEHFLNYGDISLGFDAHSHQQNDPNAMETEYTGAHHMGTGGRMVGSLNDQPDAVLSSVEIMNENIMNMGFHQAALQQQMNDAQIHASLQQQRQLQQYHMSKIIPPTPNSLELRSGDMTPQMYGNFYGMKDDQVGAFSGTFMSGSY